MIRHISIFTFRDVPEKQENIQAVRAFLEKILGEYAPMVRQWILDPAAPTPTLPDDAPVMFGDLIQIADFDTPEDAAGYPVSDAHLRLSEFSTPMLKKVTAFDFVWEA